MYLEAATTIDTPEHAVAPQTTVPAATRLDKALVTATPTTKHDLLLKCFISGNVF